MSLTSLSLMRPSRLPNLANRIWIGVREAGRPIRVTSDGFNSVLENEPDSAAKPPSQHLEKRPAAFWKNRKESRDKKLGWKKNASTPLFASQLALPALPIPGLMVQERLLNLPD